MSRYRADIDGLRAIAIVGVVAFHSGLAGVSGGFVGVDVFFVISGYLIGAIVDREISAGQFSFAEFYARRARRILPALIAVSGMVLAFGLVLLGPDELKRFAIGAAAALVGVSNLWFVHSAEYFAPDARLEPFLMTWSLGIEEQFYLLLPPLLLIARRWGTGALSKAVLGVAIMSLVLAAVVTPIRPVEAFYLLPTRAWELGIGVGLAMAHARGFALSNTAQAWASIAGVVGILAAMTLLDERSGFPGLAALLPTVATAALIASPNSVFNRRILASRLGVAIGRVSYSWYLLHWPLLVLVRISAGGQVPAWLAVAIGFGSIVPAYASWRWIEGPFRQRVAGRAAAATLVRYGAGVGLSFAGLVGVAVSGGIPVRVGGTGRQVQAMLRASVGGPCLAGYGVAAPNLAPACAPPGDEPVVALLGDSHASALGAALRADGLSKGYRVLQMTAASCPPLLGATLTMTRHPGASQACAAFNAAAIARAANDPRVKLVILTGLWNATFDLRAIARGERVIDADPRLRSRSGAAEFEIALTRTLVRFRNSGKRVIVLGDVPWLRIDPALQIWSSFLPVRRILGDAVTPGMPSEDGLLDRSFADPLDDRGGRIVAARAAAVPGVEYVALRDMLCGSQYCRTSYNSMPFYIDPQHLSRVGADYAIVKLGPALRSALPQAR